MKNWKKTSIIAATTFGMLIGGLNINPVYAKNLTDLGVSQEYIFRNYKVEEDTYEADIQILTINTLKNKDLEADLNKKFMAQGQTMYDEFNKEIESMKADGVEGYIGVGSEYQVKTDDDNVLSIVLTEYTGMGSSNTIFKTYNIDKEKQSIINLKDLFKDDKYIQIISNNIKEQMSSITKADETKTFFIGDDSNLLFEKIKADQNFYINNWGELVILFDKYEVAPGYMGAQEFIIPTEAIQSLLVTQNLII